MDAYQSFFAEKLEQLKTEGNYRQFLEVNKSAQHFPNFYYTDEQGTQRSAVNWCSNDYLGMSTREEVIAKMGFVTHRAGAGSGGTRNISGTTNHHRELELTLANWHNKQAALVFNGAYAANMATLQTIGRAMPELVFFSDERNHASLIEGMRAAGNKKIIFRHNDAAHLESLLEELPLDTPKMIVLESVYSIKGTTAPLHQMAHLAKKYRALSYVDEVHAVGMYGATGAGMLEQEGLSDAFDIVNGTLSKAIGVYGGYIASSAVLVDFIRSFGSGFIFTTSLPPAICSAAQKSIELIRKEEEMRASFFSNVHALRKSFDDHGINYTPNNTHITSIKIGNAIACKKIARELLLKKGVYLQPINYPTVPKGEECLRIVCTSRHLPKHINQLTAALVSCLPTNTVHSIPRELTV